MESVKEFSAEHEKNIKAAVDQLIASGTEEGLLILENDEGRFVQFTYSPGEGLTLELPRTALSDEQRRRLESIEGMEACQETELSLLLPIGVDSRMGARLAHAVFREVFGCPPAYRLQATLDI